jgi:putative transposase
MTVQSWNLPPPPNFQGLRDDLPLTVYMRHLPHWRQPGATYFVTFRLADSLPQSKLDELESIRREWDRRVGGSERASKEELESLAHVMMAKHERWLDDGHGDCQLKRKELAQLVANSMHYFDGERYELNAYVVMHNHVHVILRPFSSKSSLEDILGSWKQFSARQINELIGRSGTLWQDECYDRIIRDEEHLYRCLQYVGSNPSKVGGRREHYCCWIRPAW